MARLAILHILAALFMAAGGAGLSAAPPIPKGYQVPAESISSDQRLGVTVPITSAEPKDARNRVIDLKTGEVVATLKGETGWTRHNHGGVLPARWGKDNSILVWAV